MGPPSCLCLSCSSFSSYIKPTTHPSPLLSSLSLPCSQKARTQPHTHARTPPPTITHRSSFSSSSTTTTAAAYTGYSRACGGAGRHGEVPVLREGAHQQGRLDQGGGPAPHRLHQGPWRGMLEIPPQSRRAAAVREELQAAVDQLPQARPQAGQLHRGGGRAHHQATRAARQQVVADRREAAGEDGQRDQELLEHAHQAEAPGPRHGPADPPPAQCHRPHAGAAAPDGARTALRRCSPPAEAGGGSLHSSLQLGGASVQPQQRRRRAVRVRHAAARAGARAAPRHRPQPLHQPGAVPAGRASRGEARSGEPQCDVDVGSGGVPVLQPPRVPGRRRRPGLQLRRRRRFFLHAAAAAAGQHAAAHV